MPLRTLNAENAADLDKDLMSVGAFSLDQLMELAGLSVSQAVYQVHPPEKGKRVLIAVGPGNNGGDGLVAARHLWHYGYQPTIFYPKQSKNELYQRLSEQLNNLGVPFTDDFEEALKNTDHVVDAIFGFSFSGEVREPFAAVITALENTQVPVTAVDAPSSWSIEDGPPKSGPGAKFNPEFLISLTAPKPLVSHFTGRHFVGGRFLPPSVAEKYNLDVPEYKGVDQIVELPAGENVKSLCCFAQNFVEFDKAMSVSDVITILTSHIVKPHDAQTHRRSRQERTERKTKSLYTRLVDYLNNSNRIRSFGQLQEISCQNFAHRTADLFCKSVTFFSDDPPKELAATE
ncbi:MAG: hypothetical protein L6R40_006412 [Gallowayella cf. fulva]|nr:MAG: hypothetical protein L6R40_006412 [Xanthomendoza cf. fulva]